jgi:hypothetical protein
MAITSVSDRPVRVPAPEAQPNPRPVNAPNAPAAPAAAAAPKVTTVPAIEDTYKPTLPRSGNLGREAMTSKLTAGGGYVQLDQLPDTLKAQLRTAGVTDRDLAAVAGSDGAIRGKEDFQRLFSQLDKGDKNGSADSVALTDQRGQATAQGRALQELDRHIAANRNRAAAEGGTRFAGDKRLEAAAKGGPALRAGETGEHIEKVQTALADMGLGNKETMKKGVYDEATMQGVRRFQREAGLTQDGLAGKDTLGALTATAPKAGQVSKASADYDKLFADGRVDIGIAVGFDEDGHHGMVETDVRVGLQKQGFKETPLADIEKMAPADRERLGLTDQRLDKNAAYFLKDDGAGNKDDAVARMITPAKGGPAALEGYKQMLRQDELVVYGGHARYGTGPDFDKKSSGEGNFVVDGHGNRRGDHLPGELRSAIPDTQRSDLSQVAERPAYQVLGFHGCTTEDYLTRLRANAPGGRDSKSTDVYTTSMVGRFNHVGPSISNLVGGTMERQSNRQIMELQNASFAQMLRGWKIPGKEGDPREGSLLITGSGFLDSKER